MRDYGRTTIIFFLLSCLTAGAQVYTPGNNMIANGDFMCRDPHQRPLCWIIGMGLQTAVITGAEKHGLNKDDQSLRVTDTSLTGSVLVRSEKRIADPGTAYKAIAWVKARSGSPGIFTLEFWDQNNVIIGSGAATVTPATGWQQLTIERPAPDKCTHVTVSVTTGPADTGVSFWDDIALSYDMGYDAVLQPGVRELLMDDYRIERITDMERIVHPAVTSPILIKATEPWEGTSTYIYGTVLHDEPRGSGYRMWYCSYFRGNYFVCYATSTDGLHWVKPKLGITDFNGSRQNNICRVGGGTVVYDPDDNDTSRRYKMMSFDGVVKENFGYNVYFSPDGLHWTHYPKPVLPYGDVSNVAYDRERKLFIATTKQRMLVSNTSVTPGKNDRAAFVSVSNDFINWHAPGQPGSLWSLAVEGDPADDRLVMAKGGTEANVYGMPVYPYEGVYIGMPWFFDIMTYTAGEFASTGDGKIQPQVAVSRDLRHWSRLVRDPVIPLGKAGTWSDGTLYTASTMQVSNRQMSVYFGAMDLPHGGGHGGMVQHANIARAMWRRDGLISLYNGGYDTGYIVTKAIRFTGGQMRVNVSLRTGGWMRVELLDTAGNAIKGYQLAQSKPITGDQYEAVVQWEKSADISQWQGKEIKLRFQLLNGDLYSYWFR